AQDAHHQDAQKPGLTGLDTLDGTAGLNDPMMPGPLSLPRDGRVSLASPALENELAAIIRLDRGFNLALFAQGAQDAFVMIVEAFAANDRELLKSLLSPDLYKAFDTAMTGREAEGQTMVTEIHAIRQAQITD